MAATNLPNGSSDHVFDFLKSDDMQKSHCVSHGNQTTVPLKHVGTLPDHAKSHSGFLNSSQTWPNHSGSNSNTPSANTFGNSTSQVAIVESRRNYIAQMNELVLQMRAKLDSLFHKSTFPSSNDLSHSTTASIHVPVETPIVHDNLDQSSIPNMDGDTATHSDYHHSGNPPLSSIAIAYRGCNPVDSKTYDTVNPVDINVATKRQLLNTFFFDNELTSAVYSLRVWVRFQHGRNLELKDFKDCSQIVRTAVCFSLCTGFISMDRSLQKPSLEDLTHTFPELATQSIPIAIMCSQYPPDPNWNELQSLCHYLKISLMLLVSEYNQLAPVVDKSILTSLREVFKSLRSLRNDFLNSFEGRRSPLIGSIVSLIYEIGVQLGVYFQPEDVDSKSYNLVYPNIVRSRSTTIAGPQFLTLSKPLTKVRQYSAYSQKSQAHIDVLEQKLADLQRQLSGKESTDTLRYNIVRIPIFPIFSYIFTNFPIYFFISYIFLYFFENSYISYILMKV